jgi:hypothetical protein
MRGQGGCEKLHHSPARQAVVIGKDEAATIQGEEDDTVGLARGQEESAPAPVGRLISVSFKL